MRNVRKELGKLISYAKALDISVYFHEGEDAGGWTTDGKTIYIHTMAPLKAYLTLLHELSHHRQYIKDGMNVPFKVDKAYRKECNLNDKEILEKKYRKIIYETEKKDSKHQLDIHYETQSSIPLKYIKREIEYDLWIYKVYYVTGKIPSKKEGKEMRKRLTKKWKCGRVY